jgi:hypothetical protein
MKTAKISDPALHRPRCPEQMDEEGKLRETPGDASRLKLAQVRNSVCTSYLITSPWGALPLQEIRFILRLQDVFDHVLIFFK